MSDAPNPLNPYAAHEGPAKSVADDDLRLPLGQTRGMVNQVLVIGILMIVQGVLNLIMAVGCAGYSVFMPEVMRQAAKQQGGGPQMPPNAIAWMTYGLGAMAVVALIVGVFNIYSGINIMRFRGRTTAIVSLSLGLGMISTCYCFPTSLALAIYGLIVLLNPSVKLAFELATQGRSAKNIQRSFAMLP